MLFAREADVDGLMRFAEANRDRYAAEDPFPHAMMDGFADPDLLDRVVEEAVDPSCFSHMEDGDQDKFAMTDTQRMGPATRQMLRFLNSREVINWLESLTGIEGLVPDPHFAGGGLHELREGGFLRVHADFNYQKKLRLDRRINLLLYLNKDWDEAWGGNLELWDKDMSRCVRRYTPEFNRCVVFNTTDDSYHGNPEPVAAPDGRVRRSIAMYYYTNGRPAGEVSAEHMTLFRKRPGERTASDAARSLARQVTPPILFESLRRLKG